MATKVMMAAASLLVNMLLARVLTPAEMGTYFLIASVVGIATTVSMFGLGLSVVNQVSNLLGKSQLDSAKTYATNVLMCGVLGALTGALFFLLPSGTWVVESLIHSHALLAVIGLVATQIFFQSLLSLSAEVFRSFHEIRFASIFTGASVMLTLTASLALIVLWDIQASLVDVLEIQLVWIALSLVCALWLLRPYLRWARADTALHVMKSAVPLFVVSLSWLAYRLDLIFVQAYQGADDVAIYGAASKLVLTMAIPLELVNAFVTPIVGELWARGEVMRLERILQGATAVVSIPAVFLFGILVFFSEDVLRMVYGDFYKSGAEVLIILSFGQLINVLTGSVAWTLIMTRNEHLLLKINLGFGVVMVAVSLLAVKAWGTTGLAVAIALVFAMHNLALLVALKYRSNILLWPNFNVISNLMRSGK